MNSIPILILAGGRGTRLGPLTDQTPKPMVSVNGKPFLSHLITSFQKQGFSHFFISTGYQGHVIAEYFSQSSVQIIHENTPMGTGGAIRKALSIIKSPHILVINGDTFFDIDLKLFCEKSLKLPLNSPAIACLKQKGGNISFINENRIQFHACLNDSCTHLNGGIYLIPKSLYSLMPQDKFSLEAEYLSPQNDLIGFSFENYFLDIGTPENLKKAQSLFNS